MDWSTFWQDVAHPSADMIVALSALVMSLLDFFLHCFEYARGRIRLGVSQDFSEPAYSFGFTYYRPYHCAFVRLNIVNYSSDPISILRFELRSPDGAIYRPSSDIVCSSDYSNDCSLVLFDKNSRTIAEEYSLSSENLMNDLRFDTRDAHSGFLTFYDVPPIDKPTQTFTLITYVGRKRLRTKVRLTQLPSNLMPQHGVK